MLSSSQVVALPIAKSQTRKKHNKDTPKGGSVYRVLTEEPAKVLYRDTPGTMEARGLTER
jgi:hypothetical protein